MPKVKVIAAMMVTAVSPLLCFLLNGVAGYRLLSFTWYEWAAIGVYSLLLSMIYCNCLGRGLNLRLKADCTTPFNPV